MSATMPIGQVDQEDPVPRRDADQPAAQDRAEDRAEQHRDAEHRHDAADPVGSGGAGQDRHAERHQHAAAETLEDPEAPPASPATSAVAHRTEPAVNRATRQQVEALGAEPVGGPAGQRDHAGQGQGVGGHRPGHLGGRRVELGLEGLEGDGHHGDVEDRHDGAEDDDAGDDQDAAVEALVAVAGGSQLVGPPGIGGGLSGHLPKGREGHRRRASP